VLHRDVKLENLLCDTRRRPPSVKLCDFGHSISLDSASRDHSFYGTPGYAAPEVCQGPLWTCAADAWAMGVVMYALLSNSLPFEDTGWKRPADFTSRSWWKISSEAKLLLQALLEREWQQRGSLETFAASAWATLGLGEAMSSGALSMGMRHVHSMRDMAALGTPMGSMPHAASWNNGLDSLMDGSEAPLGADNFDLVMDRAPDSYSLPQIFATPATHEAMSQSEPTYNRKESSGAGVVNDMP